MQRFLRLCGFPLQLSDAHDDRLLFRGLALVQGSQNAGEAIRRGQPLHQLAHDAGFCQASPYRLVHARSGPFVDGAGAFVIVVDLAMTPGAAGRRHGPLAASAVDQPAEERRGAVQTGTPAARLPLAQLSLHGVVGFAIDDLRHFVIDDLAIRVLIAMLVEDVPGTVAGIGFAKQHFVNGAVVEFATPAGTISGSIEVLDDVAHTHRARRAVAFESETKDETDDICFDGVDLELTLCRPADRFGRDGAITERGGPSVRKAESGGRGHAPHGADMSVMGFEFVRESQCQSHQFAAIARNDVLGHGARGDAVRIEIEHGPLLVQEVAERPRYRMHQDGVDGARPVQAACQHLLEFGALQRTRAFPGIAIEPDHRPALTFAMVAHLELLLLEREPVLGLLVGGNANIEHDPVGAARSVVGSSASAAGHVRSYRVFRASNVEFAGIKPWYGVRSSAEYLHDDVAEILLKRVEFLRADEAGVYLFEDNLPIGEGLPGNECGGQRRAAA